LLVYDLLEERPMPQQPIDQLDLREQIARIDQLLADHDRKRQEIHFAHADHDRTRQEIRLAPWQLALTGMTTGAALFAAGAAFVKLLEHI
jgi:hypothetical protein